LAFTIINGVNALDTSPDDGMPSVSVQLLQSTGIFQKPSFKEKDSVRAVT